MRKYQGVEFEKCRQYIQRRHDNGVEWDLIRYLTVKATCANQSHLVDQLDEYTYDGWPELSIEQWFELFDECRQDIEEYEAEVNGKIVKVSTKTDYTMDLSPAFDDPNSCWNRYKYKLVHCKNFSDKTVRVLQDECEWIVRNLKNDTRETDPVMGLVVGSVQSGKTGNMAGVIAIAADLGFNFFIVLSGLITNLREQTANRLFGDLALLNGEADPKLKLEWTLLPYLSPKCEQQYRLSSLHLSEKSDGLNNNIRYLNVCLKNKKRLRDLLGWLQMQDAVGQTGQLKVLIIDDECDQAGVNTADVTQGDQTRIFQLIKGLCDHGKPGQNDTVVPGVSYRAANYIAYSATPFANILNDGDPKTSLFPRDFISSLPMSLSYWGPSRLFGAQSEFEEYSDDDFPFVNKINTEDVVHLRQVHAGNEKELPPSLKESINWFLCAGAVRRVSGTKKPVSMLVHTSNKTSDHTAIARAIEVYFSSLAKLAKTDPVAVMEKLQLTYENQNLRLSAKGAEERFTDYEGQEGASFKDLPSFWEIADALREIVSSDISRILIADETASNMFEYGTGVHLCVDNSCSTAPISDENGEAYTLRIKYPNPDQSVQAAPLFLVVGGNTLSRGLTLEGLVCSYFMRTVRQSDSLMQMGRWFGYRFGYELLPRIWLTEDTLAKFCLLNQVDLDLRQSLREAMESGLPPEQMRPCIRDTSDVISRFTLTSPKKMQMAEVAQEDYAGSQRVMVAYDTDEAILASNEDAVLCFLSGLADFVRAPDLARANYYCEGVDWPQIKDLLLRYHVSNKGHDFQRLDLLVKYVERQMAGRMWTVIVAGNDPMQGVCWTFGKGHKIGTVKRSCSRTGTNYVAFQHVTSPTDFVCDIVYDEDCVAGTQPFTSNGKGLGVTYYRTHASRRGKDKTPLLIINRINAEYLKSKGVNVSRDIYGLAFYFPPMASGSVGSYTKLRVGNLIPVSSVEPESEV